MVELDFVDDGMGNLTLMNKDYIECAFRHLDFTLPVGKFALIRNVRFQDCRTEVGTCVIGSHFTLDNVVFSNFDCHGAILISSEAGLKEVVVEGRRPQSLVIRPESNENSAMPSVDQAGFQIDISGFHGEVIIMGIRGDMVRKDSERHVAVKVGWIDEVEWQELGIGKSSYWRIFLRKLKVSNTAEGVFSLPAKSDKNYARTMKEKELLEDVGLRFE